MSGITLSASVRQNLLSLQSTADLLSVTQNRLATGNKVNSALDNPTNFFTAQGLDNRASDINNLLDGIGNGVQILQAANTGITSLQKLVDSAKSVANQALQATSGYSAKASVTSAAITNNGVPVTADDLRGAGTVSGGTLTGAATTATGSVPITSSTKLSALGITNVEKINFTGGKSIDFVQSGANFYNGAGTWHMALAVATVGDVMSALGGFDGNTWTMDGSGAISVSGSGTGFSMTDGNGTPLAKLGLTGGAYTAPTTFNAVTLPGTVTTTNSTRLSNLSSAITASDTLTVNGKTITFANSGGNSFSATGATIDLSMATTQNLLTAIDTISGTGTPSTLASGAIELNGASGGAFSVTGSALSKLGLSATTGNSATETASGSGDTLSFAAVGNGTATTITFGDGTNGTVKTLDQLNTQLAANNLAATLDTAGKLTITTTNDVASSVIPTPTGTAVSSSAGAFHSSSVTAPIADDASQSTRASLVAQYNQIIANILTTTQDASFNGVNLLNGDTLALTFNETGKSKLSITGVVFDPAGLGLESLKKGTDFLDNAGTNKLLTSLNDASSRLRSQASAFGSNLSVVQMRQDFSKQMINVLQNGASALTLADTNEEAANSQALSTRQSIAVSALSLANQSQQGVLQLLR